MSPIRLLLADDHTLVRAGIRSLLDSVDGVEVIAESGDGREALELITEQAFATTDLLRLEAHVFEWNPASCRVLEKAGYTLEGRMRRGVVKDGRVIDYFSYARLR